MTDTHNFCPMTPLQTPVLFLVFNRLDTTQRVFEQIKKAKPPRLYIGADGARDTKEGELAKVEEIRQYILNNIDWECEVKTLFRDKNLGCKKAVSSAITWFFEHEPQGIILEDDCLPVQSFFWFCEEMLNHYKDDKRVWHISGDNFQNGVKRGDGSYYFSRYPHIWGWATWADRWQEYDVDLKSLEEFGNQNMIVDIFDNPSEQRFWLQTFKEVKEGKIDTWDYQWSYCSFVNNGLCILPNVNMISNIGFGENATHTHDLESEMANIESKEIDFPIVHPTFKVANKIADGITGAKSFHRDFILKRLVKGLIRRVLR